MKEKYINFDIEKTIFCNVTWMKWYKGITDQDPVYAGGSYVKKNKNAAEQYNFNDWGDSYLYGYFPLKNNMNIQRLGAQNNDTKVLDVTVIWTAKHPDVKRKHVVGWYKNATVFREMQTKDKCLYRVYAKGKNCHLVPVDERLLEVPCGKKGQPSRALSYCESLDFSDKENKYFLKRLDSLMEGTTPNKPAKNRKKSNSGSGKQGDVEKRRAVEKAAIDCVKTHYENRGWKSKSVEGDNVGWDLTMTQGKDELHVEVKGHQGDKINSELTPNEYANAKKPHAYRLAVVTKALTKAPCLRVFEPIIYRNARKLQWISILGKDVQIKSTEKIGAVISET